MTTTINSQGMTLPEHYPGKVSLALICLCSLFLFFTLMPLVALGQPALAPGEPGLSVVKTPPPKVVEKIQQARKLVVKGRVKQADALFKQALERAVSPLDKAIVTVQYADALSRRARLKKESVQMTDKAALLYRKALPTLRGEPRVKAANNFGSLLLRKNRPAEALEVLLSARTETGRLKGPPKARYLYNLGRATEKNSGLLMGLKYYQNASIEDPYFAPAATAALRLLGAVQVHDGIIPPTIKWLNVLLDNGETHIPEEALHILIQGYHSLSPESMNLVQGALVRFLADTRTSPMTFKARWQPSLERVADTYPSTRATISYLRFLYFENTHPDFNYHRIGNQARPLLRAVSGPRPWTVVSSLCTAIGDYYQGQGDINRALSSYATAWAINTTNTRAAYRAARILLDYPGQIPRADNLLNQFISFLFRQKARAYLGEDWQNILRFHLVLASIYTGRKQWGNSRDPQSAIFQLEHAINAHRRLKRALGPGAGSIAKVMQRLARAYEQKGNLPRAGHLYMDAMDRAQRENNMALAQEIAAQLLASPARYGIPETKLNRLKEIAGG